MQVDAFAIRLRTGSPMQAADLGVRLCQHAARFVYPCFVAVLIPVGLLCCSTFYIATWLPALLLWCAKPWLDRTVLFVLSRAAFGQSTSLRNLWDARRQVFLKQFFWTWTLRRLSPWRSLTQPVFQLEGTSVWKLRKRLKLIRSGHKRDALLMTSAFGYAETCLCFAVVSLWIWFLPMQDNTGIADLFKHEHAMQWGWTITYLAVIAFLEPFYVACGFAMYLNRRAQLEAWDIEQEFRRAFAA
ncbi:MAG: hypothetical protein JF626_07925 [Polaromonas sp.]|nr:hypothetical protein [Polaromonas sp.]